MTKTPSKSDVEELIKILVSKGLTISTAESITAGNIQSLIASVSGASKSFVGGITAYGLDSKVDILHVNKKIAIATNCVSDVVADQMALGALRLFNSDISISTCGYAETYEPDNITEPFAYISIITKSDHGSEDHIHRYKVSPNGNRIEVQKQVSDIAVHELLSILNIKG